MNGMREKIARKLMDNRILLTICPEEKLLEPVSQDAKICGRMES
jgi:hypothetical protein